VLKYSVVIPLHNEQENITELYDRLKAVMESQPDSWELVLVDDGSTDRTFTLLREIAAVDSRVVVVKLRRNFGQTAGLAAGFDPGKARRGVRHRQRMAQAPHRQLRHASRALAHR